MTLLWYGLQTRSRKEECATKHLEKIDGIKEIFIAQYFCKRKQSYIKLLPRHIFVLIDAKEQQEAKTIVLKANMLDDIASVTSFSPIPHKEIEQLKLSVSQYKGEVRLAIGSSVRIKSGPFVDFSGVIEYYDGDKVSVSLYILGRQTSVTVSDADIEHT